MNKFKLFHGYEISDEININIDVRLLVRRSQYFDKTAITDVYHS